MNTNSIIQCMFLFLAIARAVGAQRCSSNSDCLYGGVCNADIERCTCMFPCKRFTTPTLVCAGKRLPQRECTALTKACELQQNVVLIPFNSTMFKVTRSCKKIVSNTYEEFCPDQSYCSGNGMCMRRIGLQQQYCRCVSGFSGDRCENKTPVLMHVADPGASIGPGGQRFFISNDANVKHGKYGPAPFIVTAIASSAITTFVLFYLRRFFRSKASKLQTNDSNAAEGSEDANKKTNVVRSVSAPALSSKDSFNDVATGGERREIFRIVEQANVRVEKEPSRTSMPVYLV